MSRVIVSNNKKIVTVAKGDAVVVPVSLRVSEIEVTGASIGDNRIYFSGPISS